jgi:thiol peroxidase
MASITLKGTPLSTVGDLPEVGSTAPDFSLVGGDLKECTLGDIPGNKVLNIFPSVDTGICAISVRTFNEKANNLSNTTIINISMDLPFAQKRFCGSENLQNVTNLSAFRSSFANEYGVKMTNGPLKGLCARSVLVLDQDNVIIHAELVPEIAQEPDYDSALSSIKSL